MYYEKKIHELELLAGAYRYLESLAKKYSAKYKSFDDYVFILNTCENKYDITIPELDFQFWRHDDDHVVFHLTGNIKRVKDEFKYSVSHFNRHEDKDYSCSTEEDMIEMFDKFLKMDYKNVQQVNQRKTLKVINSLAG